MDRGTDVPDDATLCDVSELVFETKCIMCHGAGATAPDLT